MSCCLFPFKKMKILWNPLILRPHRKRFVSMLYEEWKWYMTNARPSADWRGSPSLNKLRYRQRTHTHPCLRTCTILCVLIFLLYFCMGLIQYTKQKHMNTHPCLRTCTILHIFIFYFLLYGYYSNGQNRNTQSWAFGFFFSCDSV